MTKPKEEPNPKNTNFNICNNNISMNGPFVPETMMVTVDKIAQALLNLTEYIKSSGNPNVCGIRVS